MLGEPPPGVASLADGTTLDQEPPPRGVRARDREARDRRRDRTIVVAVVVVALLPVLVLAVRSLFQGWVPVGDVATIGVRVSEVGTTHTPLVGPYSHFGWSHPGPLLYELLAGPYHLLGASGDGLLLGALLVNGFSIAVIVARLHRYGGVALAFFGIACFGLLSWSLGASWLWYPWNPNIAMLPFAALLVVTWTTARNLRWDWPLLAVFASFIVQTHVAYLPYAVVLVPIAAIGRMRSTAPSRNEVAAPAPDGRVTWIVTGVVLAAAWIPPVVQAIAHEGGNFRDLVDFWLSDHASLGMRDALRIMALELSPRGPWLGFHDPMFLGAVAPRGFPIPVALFVLLGATIVAWRTKDRYALRSCLVVLAAIVVGTLSVARIVGLGYPYLLFSTRVIAAATWLVAIWTFVRLWQRADPARARPIATVTAVAAGGVVIVMLVVSSIGAGIGPTDELAASKRFSGVADRVRSAIGDRPGTVRVDSVASFSGGTFKAGLMFDLLRHGYRVHAAKSDEIGFGPFIANSERGDTELFVTAGSHEFEAVPPSFRLLAESARPVPFPSAAPPMHDGEDPHVYLARVEHLVDRRTFAQLVANLTLPYPVAVFERPVKP